MGISTRLSLRRAAALRDDESACRVRGRLQPGRQAMDD
jgi:hypothetical protein